MTDACLYLIEALCPNCGECVEAVERCDDPVPIDQDVPLSFAYCPGCGIQIAETPGWDLQAEHQVERVLPTQEQPNQHSGGNG